MVTRILAATLAVCLAFVTIEPVYVAPCEHHAPALALIAAAQHMHGHAGHAGHAGRADHAEQMQGHGDHDPSHSNGGGCGCLGACCTATSVAVAEPPVTVFVPAEQAIRVPLPVHATAIAAPELREHLLPLATAPPTAQLA